MYELRRQQILEAAHSLIGLPFVHQGRSAETGVDCVGLLVVVARMVDYPDIKDIEGYRRIPSSTVIKETLAENLDEIALADARPGDVFLMKQGGLLARHASIYYSDEFDVEKGVEPQIIHAVKEGVRIEPISAYTKSWYVSAFRMRGLID
jgi:cell wall-associated NlpC family hydrolase